ncbi:hypothetical protein R1sor_027172 [Riccia sorocarpa]|uniref:Endonuclease/exonuclease/phosphatase domain-containing protein n=1 Tax=Riccia sorocarpa TaxID=122646 RepID=A0ABD3GJ82_9MARC
MATLWNDKRTRGRGFGGIVVYSREGLNLDLKIECEGAMKQFLGISISSTDSEAFLLIVYLAPYGAPINRETDDPFAELSQTILQLKERGPTWIIGDFNSRIGTEKRSSTLHLDPSSRNLFQCEVTSSLLTDDINPPRVAKLVLHAARRVFGTVTHRQPWFDQDCHDARTLALVCSPDTRQEAFRSYKYFIRGRKRRFIKEQQRTLTEELKKDLVSFWNRLRTRRISPPLLEADLKDYVALLYSFPTAGLMDPPSGPSCVFSEEEVALEMCKLGTHRAADILDLKI